MATAVPAAVRWRVSTSSNFSRVGGDASLVRHARIEDHRLLADLYFAVLEAPSALVHVQHSTGSGLLCVDQPEAPRDCAFSEQALAGTDNHRELPDAKRIDKIVLEQGLEEVAAAVDLNLAAFLYLELQVQDRKSTRLNSSHEWIS